MVIIWLLGFTAAASGQMNDQGKNSNILPLVFFNSVLLDEQNLNTAGGGIIVMTGEQNPGWEERKDSLMAALMYGRFQLEDGHGSGSPEDLNNINFVIHRKTGRHQYFSMINSSSDIPIGGEQSTLVLVNGYGYQFYSSSRHSFSLGGSLAYSDRGMELINGITWPLMPLPFVHYEYRSSRISGDFDFTTTPMIDLVIAPERKLHLNSSLLILDLTDWKETGLQYDLNLEYRFFARDSDMGDFAGIKAGLKSENFSSSLSDSDDDSREIGWKTVYAALDLSFLEVSGGYALGKSYNSKGNETDLGEGFVFNIQLAYAF